MNNQKGMTLVELIIVVVIMGIMFILAIPTFTSTSASKVKSAARDIATELQMARMKAIYQNCDHRVVLSNSGSSPFGYKLEIKDSTASDPPCDSTWGGRYVHSAAAGYNPSPACSSLNANGYFCIEGVTVTHNFSGNNIEFNRVGSAVNGTITISKDNVTKSVVVYNLTGRVRIE